MGLKGWLLRNVIWSMLWVGANKDGHLTVYRIIESMYAQMLTTWFTLALDTLDYDAFMPYPVV